MGCAAAVARVPQPQTSGKYLLTNESTGRKALELRPLQLQQLQGNSDFFALKLDGTTVAQTTIDVGCTVHELKLQMSSECPSELPDASAFSLVYNHTLLSDHSELSESGIAPGEQIQLTLVKLPPVTMRETEMFGGWSGAHNGWRDRIKECNCRLLEFPTDAELGKMSRAQLEAFHFTHVAWKARGGLDGLQFRRSDGVLSPFFGSAPINKTRRKFGDVRPECRTDSLHNGDIRAIDVYWYSHDVTGLAFIGADGTEIAKEIGCLGTEGPHRIELQQTEKLVGFRFWSDHCIAQISFKIADMGVPQV